ncbi:MAG TPA: hypothetical protein P5110_01215 [Candidatus Omnitrophota bacterium]|nr:hypothetical protein [Candidatus Omnitrophota bacterium]HRZ14105.1 hypothetical protein [Candidatus Omnitrophota bacterium]
MKKFIFLLLIIIPLFCPSIQAQTQENEDGEWYPFYFPEKLDPDSPMNIGKLVLDAPAGKHGFCKVKDGHFYFEDGTRAKFWGTNLCFNACFPTKEQAEMLATRIAYFGFNAVRLHHMDFYFEPKGIFEDVCPAYKDPQMKRTGVLSKKQLDKLDYLIYQLKIRGIYIDMNLLVARHFTEADGVKFAKELGMAAKPVSMFDPKLIELQKQYAKDLLTHYNPYTKLRYCDDPVIALIEITNENSIIGSWQGNNLNGTLLGLKTKGIPDYYSQQLDISWNKWLEKKYLTTEHTIAAWEDTSTHPAQLQMIFLPSLDQWKTEQHSTAKLSKSVTSEGVTIKVKTITNTPWHLQFKSHIDITKDKNYILNFTGYSSKPTTAGLICQQTSPPWDNVGLAESIIFTTTPQDFAIPFTATQSSTKAKLAFLIGYDTSTIYLSNITLTSANNLPLKSECEPTDHFNFPRPLYKLRFFHNKKIIKDIASFYADLTKEYIDQMLSTLRTDIGIKVPITGIGGNIHEENIPAMQNCDFTDHHTYWDHPKFPHKPWDRNDFVIENKSMLQNPSLGMIGSIDKYHFDKTKPYTITEWNHCYPNKFAYESPILIALHAKQKECDALFQFAFSHGWEINFRLDTIQSYFDILSNAQQLLLCGMGSFIHLSQDTADHSLNNGILRFKSSGIEGYCGSIANTPLYLNAQPIISRDNGAIIILTNSQQSTDALFSVGEIKNSNSGWRNNKFIWGARPTLMKRIKTKQTAENSAKTQLP